LLLGIQPTYTHLYSYPLESLPSVHLCILSKISTLYEFIHFFENIHFIYILLGVVKAGQGQTVTNVLSAKDASMEHATNLSNATATNSGVAMIAKSILMHVAIHQIHVKMVQFAKINMAILHALVRKDFLVRINLIF